MAPPTTQLPLRYFGHVVGHALVDYDVGCDLAGLSWGLEIPDRERRQGQRADVLLSRFIEDPTLLPRCHPVCQHYGLVLRLSKLVLRPQARALLPRLELPQVQVATQAQIRALLSSVPRVIFVNRSRVDCRVSNLREVQVPEEGLSSGDTHPLDELPPSLSF